MVAITHQKRELREVIVQDMQDYVYAKPNFARDVAVGLASLLASRMTLKELDKWARSLAIARQGWEVEPEPEPGWEPRPDAQAQTNQAPEGSRVACPGPRWK